MKLKIISAFLATALLAGYASSLCVSAEEYSEKYEFEDGTIASGLKVLTEIEGYSGSGYVGSFSSDSQYAEVEISVPKTAKYDITVRNAALNIYKENNCYLDGQSLGTIITNEMNGWQDFTFYGVNIEAGSHKIKVSKNWGWFYVDCVTITEGSGISPSVYEVSRKLSNPNANDDAKRLWAYLCDNYGKNIISGQYDDKGQYSNEYSAILSATGKAPAVWGFDMMEYSPSRVRISGSTPTVTERSIEWAKEYGGIVTYCWHWTPNEKYLYANGEQWWSGFYTKATTFDIKAAMSDTSSEEYKYIIEDIDAIAVQLQKLEDAGVAVLWRPLHEASGGWFWWGTDRDSYIKLWNLLYDRLTNFHGLDNLIWVWNGQKGSWYPGDDTVDIVGYDIYAEKHDTSSQMSKFNICRSYSNENKMIALSENGVIPDIDNCIEDNVMWSWFGVWGGEFIANDYSLSSTYTPIDVIKKVYQSDRVITLDEVPDLSAYPIEGIPDDTDTDSEPIPGDVDNNMKLDILDVVLVRAHIVGSDNLSPEGFKRADINSDGNIDVLDVVFMRNAIVNKV